MRVLTLEADGLARCAAADGARSEVDLGLVAGAGPGDLVLVHAGVALTVLGGEPA
jgi:hydrogenase maturation factor